VNDFTPEMFTGTGIEVLGTPIGSHAYIKDFVTQNFIKIIRDVDKLELSVPRVILNGTAHSYRYRHHKSYTPERYSRFFPSSGPG
jgi:hypothetical protein